MQSLKLTINSHSIAGVKPENQDNCAYYTPDDQALEYKGIASVMADGVSASARAKEASSCCVKSFLSDYYATPDSWGTEHAAIKVISALNNWLYSQSMRAGEESSMLSTLSILIVKSNTAHIFHVGDSRIYCYRNGVLTQLTQDHVLNVNKEKTYLSRAIGFDLKVSVDYQTFDIQPQDLFLLTTDGVHDVLRKEELQQSLGEKCSCEDLVEQALKAGSKDNISAMICQVEQLPEKNLNEVFDELTQKPVPPDLEKGMKINGFEIESLLVSTAKIQLYLAKNITTSELVALKTPSINFEDDAQYLQYFMYEQWVGQRIQSPNVVKIHKSNMQDKFLAYAMEYIKGKTLRQWIDENPSPDMDVVLSIVKQIISGIRAFHRQEMLHCDLKPENIMIDKIGQIKLIDFGAARIAGVEELLSPIDASNNQGTQGYTAPEVILNDEVSQASDQFSLGAIVYEMLAGCVPYKDKLDRNLSIKKLEKLSYDSILKYDPHVPIWIDGAVQKACNLKRAGRYEVLSEFLYDLSHPNQALFSVKEGSSPENALKKYRLLIAFSFALNIVLLLLVIK
ncbi:protein kinase domain-containing protein [Candidatus Thiodubiliella endoseptemdiera]|uniref:Bifunctional protein-serine/threonine kinase/phosphatase n=1 Tax=Candidatus Thiodubiliella endoseptemdiera TaxID=2738886 RepID=A0A853F3Z2_9GAMM|nr:bifunctional protein-serine/threonine kinase/phosphatase [Candidatus Thiodubiliella endoseptemdiera]